MVSKRVWLGDRSILEASLMSLYTNHFVEDAYMPLPKKLQNNNMIQRQIVPQMVNSCWRGKNPIKPGFHRLINSRNKIRILQSMCWDGKKKNVIVHRISEKDGAIPRINVMITPQGDNTLYRLTALLYDQSKTFNSKHFCERCLHG